MADDLFRQPRGVGFSGTRRGMMRLQHLAARRELRAALAWCSSELHHGDCVGADAQMDEAAREFGVVMRHLHPPDRDEARAHCGGPGSVRYAPLPYLARNRVIVDATQILIAAPHSEQISARSGTWHAVRYAVERCKKIVLVLPSGRVIDDWRVEAT